jgi:hypothetical protein
METEFSSKSTEGTENEVALTPWGNVVNIHKIISLEMHVRKSNDDIPNQNLETLGNSL